LIINPFAILGIKQTASLKEVKSAYKKLAKIHHPDCGGDAIKFIEIKQAFDLAKNECFPETVLREAPKKTKETYNGEISRTVDIVWSYKYNILFTIVKLPEAFMKEGGIVHIHSRTKEHPIDANFKFIPKRTQSIILRDSNNKPKLMINIYDEMTPNTGELWDY